MSVNPYSVFHPGREFVSERRRGDSNDQARRHNLSTVLTLAHQGGSKTRAGEFGHSLVSSSGVSCFCGKTGCLETEVSLSRLLEVLGIAPVDGDEFDALMVGAAELAFTALLSDPAGTLGS